MYAFITLKDSWSKSAKRLDTFCIIVISFVEETDNSLISDSNIKSGLSALRICAVSAIIESIVLLCKSKEQKNANLIYLIRLFKKLDTVFLIVK